MSVVILENKILHYEVLGRGKPVLFIHGWSGSWRYWIPTMQAASISFRTYAVDLWGYGGSAKNISNYPLAEQSESIAQFIDKMGIPKTAIVAHGLGAAVSLLFAAKFPHRVNRMICVNPPSSQFANAPEPLAYSSFELANWLLGNPQDDAYEQLEIELTDPLAIRKAIESLREIDIEQVLATLQTPCLLVYGENDPLIRTYGAVRSPIQNTSKIVEIAFDKSGHFPMLDEPSKFNRLMLEFLQLTITDNLPQLQLKEEWKRRVR